ncbi:MAG: hypothetical protein Q8O03_06705 [Nanoarchaeota archaeon]|nr:hypothetical protein [Nanoarchaeota archaeon]
MIIKHQKTIKRTGINPDYINDWVITYKCITTKYEQDPEKAYDKLKRTCPFKKYTERTPQEEYKITEKNEKQVKLLDKIADELNHMLEDQSKFDCKRIKTLTNRTLTLIYGENEKNHLRYHDKEYINEWVICKHILDKHENEPEKAYKLINSHKDLFKTYTDRAYSGGHQLTEKNQKRARYLDRIVDEIKNMLEDDSKFDYKRAKTLTNRALILVQK